jgi:uncharacterized protein
LFFGQDLWHSYLAFGRMKTIQILAGFVLLFTFSNTNAQQAASDSGARYIKVPAGYLMVLRQGDDIFKELEKIAQREKIPAASLSGMGFVGSVTFGFFNRQTKQYEPKSFTDMELASMSGSIAWQDQKPSLHIHGLGTGRDFQAVGGHMLGAVVGTGTLEITIVLHDKELKRVKDEQLGANVLKLN